MEFISISIEIAVEETPLREYEKGVIISDIIGGKMEGVLYPGQSNPLPWKLVPHNPDMLEWDIRSWDNAKMRDLKACKTSLISPDYISDEERIALDEYKTQTVQEMVKERQENRAKGICCDADCLKDNDDCIDGTLPPGFSKFHALGVAELKRIDNRMIGECCDNECLEKGFSDCIHDSRD